MVKDVCPPKPQTLFLGLASPVQHSKQDLAEVQDTDIPNGAVRLQGLGSRTGLRI